MRDDGEDDNMENWNDAKLQEVVDKKHGTEKRMPTTDIVSRISFYFFLFFFSTVENNVICILSDMQIFFGSCRKVQIWLVLGMSEWREMHL